ncbi:MAG: LysM peptidoglycan-binding domain-containing protein [Anaerolineae bacterium]|nr:LysM peptidoglycan-binding domain-containing protein [Anaerolineae bacterium]
MSGAGRLESAPVYDPGEGEDDLYVPHLLRFPWWGIVVPLVLGGVSLLVVSLVMGATLSEWLNPEPRVPGTTQTASTAVVPLQGGGGQAGTAFPTLFLPTLTPTDTPTPTPSPTPTPGPCEQIVGAGDTLITLATRCGHRDLAVIDTILQLNGLRSAESLQQGQTILIPWPTATPGAEPEDELEGEEDGATDTESEAESDDSAPTPISDVIPTATLQPGVTWYTVQPDDNIIKIAVLFDANVEILSQLNPEVTFSQCDFGMDYGGGNCIVQLYQGQQIRVPAPTATPTLSPTPSGSETPTPTPTPTFNAPALLSPGDRFLFGPDAIVTLRWTSTGMLAEGDVYLVTVTDTTAQTVHTATATETMLILPGEWQPSDGTRHLFTWEIAVGPADGQGGLQDVVFRTPTRMFFWDSP